jgi:phage shock protein C
VETLNDLEQKPTPTMSQLRRSKTDKVIAGVCGGLGRSLGVDPVWLRIAFVALTLAGGSGVLIYVIAWIAIPEGDDSDRAIPVTRTVTPALIVGGILIVIGAVTLLGTFAPWMTKAFWPLVIVGIGAALMMGGLNRDRTH